MPAPRASFSVARNWSEMKRMKNAI